MRSARGPSMAPSTSLRCRAPRGGSLLSLRGRDCRAKLVVRRVHPRSPPAHLGGRVGTVLVCRRIRSTSLGAELDRSATRTGLRDGEWCLAFAARLRTGPRVRTRSGHVVNEPPAFGLEARTRQARSRTARSRLRVLERSGLRTAASGQRVLQVPGSTWSSRAFGFGWIRTSSREEQPTSVGCESFGG